MSRLPTPLLRALLPTRASPRWLVAWMPAFRVERCGWSASDVVVLVAERRNATRVVGLTPAARDAGLAEEMTVAEARALVADVLVEPWEEAAEQADRAALVRALDDLCDRVEAWGEDAVVLEVSRTSPLHGGEAGVLERVDARLRSFGHRAVVVVAGHPLAAHALARAGQHGRVVPSGGDAAALAPWPVAWLGPSPALDAALHTLGIHTIGAWAALDPASVTGRWGAEGARLHRVARGAPPLAGEAVGGANLAEGGERPRAGAGDEPWRRARVVADDGAVTVDALVLLLQEGLRALRGQLAPAELGVSRLEVRIDLEEGPPERMTLELSKPTVDIAVISRLLRMRLERLTLASPAEAVVLCAADVAPTRAVTLDLLERREVAEPLEDVLDRVGEALGAERVIRPRRRSGWRPEGAWRDQRRGGRDDPDARDVDDPVAWQEAPLWDLPRLRPTRLLPLPQPVRLVTEHGRPVRLRGPRAWWSIADAEGPERLGGEWWSDAGGFERDYWRVRVIDAAEAARAVWLWVFEERGQWFLHGCFD